MIGLASLREFLSDFAEVNTENRSILSLHDFKFDLLKPAWKEFKCKRIQIERGRTVNTYKHRGDYLGFVSLRGLLSIVG